MPPPRNEETGARHARPMVSPAARALNRACPAVCEVGSLAPSPLPSLVLGSFSASLSSAHLHTSKSTCCNSRDNYDRRDCVWVPLLVGATPDSREIPGYAGFPQSYSQSEVRNEAMVACLWRYAADYCSHDRAQTPLRLTTELPNGFNLKTTTERDAEIRQGTS